MKKKLMISLALIVVVMFGYYMQASACTLTASITANCVEVGTGGYEIVYTITGDTDTGAVMEVTFELNISTLPTITGSFYSNGAPFTDSVPVPCDTYTISGSVTLPYYNTVTIAPFTVDCPCPPPPGQGCTPGFWKNHIGAWEPTGLSTSDIFDFIFGVSMFGSEFTLLDAVWARGGGNNRLARHGTAALLNALHPDVDYPLTVDEVIAAVRSGDLGNIVNYNEGVCIVMTD